MPLGSRSISNRKVIKRNAHNRAIKELFKAVSKGKNAKKIRAGESAKSRAEGTRPNTPITHIMEARKQAAKDLQKARQLKRKK